MVQTLYPRDFPEGITFIRTYTGTGCVHVGELPGGKGYCRVDGQPIQSEGELTAVIPRGQRLQQALEWWEHRHDEPPEHEPPVVMWRSGKLCYVESGAELTSHAEIIGAFSEEGPMQKAALEWFAQRQSQRYAQKQLQDLQTGVIGATMPDVETTNNPMAETEEYRAGRRRRLNP